MSLIVVNLWLFRILINEKQFQDSMIIFIDGKVQRFILSAIDSKRSYFSSYFIIDYPYGVLTTGSVFGEGNLLVPAYATSSLFSLTCGMYLRLTQEDYMSILSLVECIGYSWSLGRRIVWRTRTSRLLHQQLVSDDFLLRWWCIVRCP